MFPLGKAFEARGLHEHLVSAFYKMTAQVFRDPSAAAADGRKFVTEYKDAHGNAVFDGKTPVMGYSVYNTIQTAIINSERNRMEILAGQFQNILQTISKLPYRQGEKNCDAIQFLLEDYIKRFPPASIKTYQVLFSALQQIADFYTRDKVMLEIGPGFNLGVMFLAALGGATKVLGVELFPHDMGPDHDFIVSMFEHVEKDPSVPITPDDSWDQQRCANEFARLITKNDAGKYAFRKDRLEYLFPYSAERLPCEDDSVDCVFTSAAFEHFRDPLAVVNELSRVTRGGGLSCHAIDMRDHRDFSQPLDYLMVTEDAWRQLHLASPSYTYTNRLRPSGVVSLFGSAGFTLLGVRPLISLRPDNELRARFVEPYASMPDSELFTLVQIFIFRKGK